MLQKNFIKVKSGIRFLSTIPDFELPNGILNKKRTGCGGTTLALEDKNPTIICCPRNELLINKSKQYPNSLLVVGGVHTDEIKKYIEDTSIPKILVSFDSFYKLLECIPDKTKYRVLVDEFQFLLQDASFKSEVGLALLNNLKHFPYVTYLSATPMLNEFISKFEFFDDIPYYELIWDEQESIDILRYKSPNPIANAVNIVKAYQNGIYPSVTSKTGEVIKSTECIFFINSVNDIVNIVKLTNLLPEETNLITGNSEDNEKQISKIGKGFAKGHIPLKGEKHKKFTFCTSTAFAGCDFYSECATTFVISDNKRLNTSIDISTDLVQIAGRQRLETNPFRKRIYFIYNTSKDEIQEDVFLQQIELKKKATEQEIQSNNNASIELKNYRIKTYKILKNVDRNSVSYLLFDENQQKFVFNELAYLNDIYSYKIQRYNYTNGQEVRNQLLNADFKLRNNQQWWETDEMVASIIKKETFEEKIMRYCELINNSNLVSRNLARSMERVDSRLKTYYEIFGSEKIKALNYKEANLKKEIYNIINYPLCYEIISKKIRLNEFIPSRDAKSIIAEAYIKTKITATPKGSDLSKWYNVTEKKSRVNGKQTRGYIVESIKMD